MQMCMRNISVANLKQTWQITPPRLLNYVNKTVNPWKYRLLKGICRDYADTGRRYIEKRRGSRMAGFRVCLKYSVIWLSKIKGRAWTFADGTIAAFRLWFMSGHQCPVERGWVSGLYQEPLEFVIVFGVVNPIHEGCGFAIPLNGFLYHFCYFHNAFILKVKHTWVN